MAPVLTEATEPAEELVRRHLPLVGRRVRELAARLPAHVDADDLTGAGRVGLVAAARAYDPARGTPFAHFASLRIRGALLDELRSLDWASRSVRSRARRLESAREGLACRLGRVPTAAELAETLGMAVDEIDVVEEDVQRAALVSLDGLTPEQAGGLVPSQVFGPEDLLLRWEEFRELHNAVAALPKRLRLVIRGLYFEERPAAEIGAELGVSHSRVSQLRSQALRALRAMLSARPSPAPVTPARGGQPRRQPGTAVRARPARRKPVEQTRTAAMASGSGPGAAVAASGSPTEKPRQPDWGLEARIRRFRATASGAVRDPHAGVA